MGAGGGLAPIFSLAIAGEGGAGMLPVGPGGGGREAPPPLLAGDLVLLALRGIFMETFIVSPCLKARSSFSGGTSFSCSIFSSTLKSMKLEYQTLFTF